MRRKDRQVHDASDILGILSKTCTCRLGLVDLSGPAPEPYVVAMDYGFAPGPAGPEGGVFWFHGSTRGRRADIVGAGGAAGVRACVQVEGTLKPETGMTGCDWSLCYESVVAFGTLRLVEDPGERRAGLNMLMGHHAALWTMPEGARPMEYDEGVMKATAVYRLDVETLTAKRRT